MDGNNNQPIPMRSSAPTSSLPALARLATHSTTHIQHALGNLRNLYWPPAPPPLPAKMTIPKRRLKHLTHDYSVPDSGYASAEDEGEEEVEEENVEACGVDEELDILRADAFERGFAIKWVTSFVARCGGWIEESSSDGEWDTRSTLLEEAISILSLFSGNEEEEEVALTRTFSFPAGEDKPPVEAELNDAPLSSEDHTSVGLQSWGSSILLAQRMCLDPARFSLVPRDSCPLRILELGAGTGLLSIVASRVLDASKPDIIATDYHPDVLANLTKNVCTNFPKPGTSPISVCALDWESPRYAPPLHEPFDVILAADVVYHPEHAEWIKRCVKELLSPHGVFWLIIPIRTTGRHEGMHWTVDFLFPDLEDVVGDGPELAVLSKDEFGRQGNVGRADEGAYKLYEIGWTEGRG